MINIRAAEERGKVNFGWLDSRHSFSFGSYFDPRHVGFGPLRVINEDRVKPGAGFDTHGHRDMEILSYVLEGALEHRDNTGTGSVIRPGDIQRMSAGHGILHSEFNHSKEEPVHFLQIWIHPDKEGLQPGYEQKSIAKDQMHNQLVLIAGPESGENSVKINQDAKLFASHLQTGKEVQYAPEHGRAVWVQLAKGEIVINETRLREGDGAAITEESLAIKAEQDAEFLLFDLPAEE